MKTPKVLLFDWNSVMMPIYSRLTQNGCECDLRNPPSYLDDWEKFDVILFWNEIEHLGWRKVIMDANKLGKKTILIQHGRRGTGRIFPPFNEPLACQEVCVWGEGDKKRLMSVGTDEKRIHVTGTTVFRSLIDKVKHNGKNIVFSPEHWSGEVMENMLVNTQMRKLQEQGYNIVTKCLTGEHDKNIYINPVFSDRSSVEHLNICARVLSEADILVSISESTFELMAEILDIPVVLADIWQPKACGKDEKYKTYKRIYSDACHKVKDITKLDKEIKYCLDHPDYLREARKQISIDDGGINIKDPVGEIVKVICQS